MGLNPHAAARLRARKNPSSSSSKPSRTAPPVKQQPTFTETRAADLGWKSLQLPAELGFDDDGGLLELDELDGVDVTYEDGKVVFKVCHTLASLPTAS